MKKLIALVLLAMLTSCATTRSNCPTTNKKYFTKGVKQSKPLYKGYGARK